MQKSFNRKERVEEQIKLFLAECLYKKVKDPRIESATITSVKMSPDLKNAIIYFCVFGGDSKTLSHKVKQAQKGFDSATGFLKMKLGEILKLKYTPNLKFFYDDTLDYAAKIDELLKNVDKDEQ